MSFKTTFFNTKVGFQRARTVMVALLLASVMQALFANTAVAEAEPSVSILMYHHVSESTPRVTSVSPDELREHLAYLKDNSFTVIDIRDAIAGVRGEKPLPEKAVVLTFDDAYENIFSQGRPILNEFGVPWTLFVTTDPIGDTPSQYMSWEQIETLHNEGVVIANHTTDHAHMPRRKPNESEAQWLERMRANILAAEQTLEQRIGVNHKLFAYPYGEYNNALANLVEELGYIGFGQHSGGFGATSDFRAIPRFAAAGVYANLRTLGTKMAALSLPVIEAHYSDTLLTHTETQPVLELEVSTRDFHKSQLQCFFGGDAQAPEWLSDTRIRIQSPAEIGLGRVRYNCTAPSISDRGRFYWYSIQWIRPDTEGNWPG
ncbi:polysaccharide deacetylase family protein [Aliidiomarina celeris]|uniref:polysaccharide deacetylase family protein n=1 Tax=Aliidiomarina celeris TaxID=2249428 RepID=UPI0013007402|nr:polysaccharide deacetylase family protein [Aliidiomarina celeris]